MDATYIIAAFNAASQAAQGLPPFTRAEYERSGEFATRTYEVPGFPGVTVRREAKVTQIVTVDYDYECEPERVKRHAIDRAEDVVRIAFPTTEGAFYSWEDPITDLLRELADSAPWEGWIHCEGGDHKNEPGYNELIIAFKHAGRPYEYQPIQTAQPCGDLYDPFADDADEVEVFGRNLKPGTKAVLKAQSTKAVDMIEARHGFDSMLRNLGLEGGAI